MSTTPPTKDEVTAGTSIACIVAALVMILLTSEFRGAIKRQERTNISTELRDPPFLTRNALDLGPYLWLAAVAASIWGFRLLITRPRDAALSWFLWCSLLTILILSLMTWALFWPRHREAFGFSPY